MSERSYTAVMVSLRVFTVVCLAFCAWCVVVYVLRITGL